MSLPVLKDSWAHQPVFWSVGGTELRAEGSPSHCPLSLLQYIFVSLISRDSVYDVLRRVCTHLQVTTARGSHPTLPVFHPSISLAVSCFGACC